MCVSSGFIKTKAVGLLILVISWQSISAQILVTQKWYVGMYGEYAYGIKQKGNVPLTVYNGLYSYQPYYSYDGVSCSLLKGFYPNAYIGYRHSAWLYTELGFSYLNSNPFHYDSLVYASGSLYSSQYSVLTVNMLRVIPKVVLKIEGKRVYFYAKSGIILSAFSQVVQFQTSGSLMEGGLPPPPPAPPTSTSVFVNRTFDWEYKGKISPGLHVSTGLGIKINNNIQLNAQFDLNMQKCSLWRGKLIRATGPYTSTQDPSFTQVQFSTYSIFSKDDARLAPTTKIPMSSIGFGLGLEWSFSKRGE